MGIGAGAVSVTLVNRNAYHSIRVRNYETDLTPTRVPLRDALDPIGVQLLEGEVRGIDFLRRAANVVGGSGMETLTYDRLVFALGSRLVRPVMAGFGMFGFDVDAYVGAVRLRDRLGRLIAEATSPKRSGVSIEQ